MKFVAILLTSALAYGRFSEVWTREQEDAAGIVRENYFSPLPKDYLSAEAVPTDFTWCDKDGVNYCTISRNQHIPQYCGSCWAHGAVSALGDRVKIARKGKGIDINLSVQHILNCANVGSCHGGSVTGVYNWLHSISQKTGSGISYETSNPYMACSSEVKEGFCPSADWSCSAKNIARTCSTFPPSGKCVGLKYYPNVTISEYGTVSGKDDMQKEILARGPISCGVDASPLHEYQTGITKARGSGTNHVVSVVGWGEEAGEFYWTVRNSWGEYWGEAGYFRAAHGALNLEGECTWAVVQAYTTTDNQVHCYEDGSNCLA